MHDVPHGFAPLALLAERKAATLLMKGARGLGLTTASLTSGVAAMHSFRT